MKSKFLKLPVWTMATMTLVLISPYVNAVVAATVGSVNFFNLNDDYDLQLLPESSSKLSTSDDNESDYDTSDEIANILQNNKKRSLVFHRTCIRRNGHCDHRPNDCCYNSSCRCNLWGSNCRCQRMGLFQKWG